jgi:hypothetical protein
MAGMSEFVLSAGPSYEVRGMKVGGTPVGKPEPSEVVSAHRSYVPDRERVAAFRCVFGPSAD